MKRDGYVIPEIVVQSNLEESFDTVVRGTHRKSLAEGKWLIAHREDFLQSVKTEILSGAIQLRGFHEKIIREGGKTRRIQVFCMADRIKVNAVMSVVDKHLRRRYIRTTSSSIKGRGMHELKAYIERDMREHPEDLRYWYKFDIRKFYETVRQDFVMYALRRTFKDPVLLRILEQFVRLLPSGLSMGLRASQGVGNLLLSVYLDHYLKDRYGIKYFYRYCDDGLIGAASKSFLWEARGTAHELIDAIGQEIKPDERIFPVRTGLDFLGYVIYPTHAVLRKRVKKEFARKLARIKSRKRRVEIVGSLWGMAKHCKSWHFLQSVLYPSELNKIKKKRQKAMRQFSELGITYKPKDGKKRFPNKAVQLRQLVNVRIEVMDYETDVETKNGLRTLVCYRDTRTNEMSKFFTASEEMRQSLDAAKGMDAIPFSAVIAAEYFGDNKCKYKFT